jgi:hypothetical protein
MFGAKAQPKPAAPRTVIDTDGSLHDAPGDLAALAIEGWQVRKEIDAMQQRLDSINAMLIEAVGPGRAIHVDGICRASIAETTRVKVEDPGQLVEILGPQRFADLVDETTTWKASPKLLTLAADADDETGRQVAACLSASSSTSVRWLGGKPLPAAA